MSLNPAYGVGEAITHDNASNGVGRYLKTYANGVIIRVEQYIQVSISAEPFDLVLPTSMPDQQWAFAQSTASSVPINIGTLSRDADGADLYWDDFNGSAPTKVVLLHAVWII